MSHKDVTLVTGWELWVSYLVDAVIDAFGNGVNVSEMECIDFGNPLEKTNSFIREVRKIFQSRIPYRWRK
jgi:hypothetical protein